MTAILDVCLEYCHALPEIALKGVPTERIYDLLAKAEADAAEWKQRERSWKK